MPKKRREPGRLFFDEITSGPFEFLWYVPEDGFVWREEGVTPIFDSEYERLGNGPPYLVPTKQFDRVRNYPPLEHPDLHRKFANVWNRSEGRSIEIEDLRRFAISWGRLGHGTNLNGIINQTVMGESRDRWCSEIVSLAMSLDVWDAVKYERDDLVRPFIKWSRYPDETRGGRFEIEFTPYSMEGAPFGFRQWTNDEEGRFEFGSVLAPFRDYLFRGINEKLRGHVSPVIHPFQDANCNYMNPDCLLSAMYVLLILEIAEFIRLKRPSKICRGCGN